MTVQEPLEVDAIAQAPDGRILLSMTEDRRYAGGDEQLMSEQFREKLNAYVHLVRSGGLRRMIGRRASGGVDIELSCRDEPPARVREIVHLAEQGLQAEGIGVRWHVVAPPTPEAVVAAIGEVLLQRAPEGTERVELVATLVGDGMAGGLVATTIDGERVPMQADDDLIGALQLLKSSAWSPDGGTWVTFRATIDRDGVHPGYESTEPAGGAGGFTGEDWSTELQRYPRGDLPGWWRAQLG